MRRLDYKQVLIPAGILLCLLSVAFYDVVFLGKTFKVTTANSQALPTGAYGQEHNKPKFIPVNGTDSPVLEEPVFQFIRENLRRGVLPLWDPHQACGFPLISMIEIGIFFPLNFIMYIFPSFWSWDILILMRLLLAGLLTYWFMRHLGFGTIPALVSGVAFMLSGPMVLLQYWTANVDILTPLLLIMIDRMVRRPNAVRIALLSAAMALTVLAGHPEHIFLVNVFGFAFLVFRLITLRKEVPVLKAIGGYGLAGLWSLALSAVVLFPFLNNLRFEFWHGHPPGVGLLMEEQRQRALTLALPHFFQAVPLTYQWVFAGWWGGYLGTLPLGLAFLSLFGKHRRPLNYFFAGCALAIIGKEYGLPVINAIGHLPVFSVCRYAIHTPGLAAFSVAVLAGMGIQAVIDSRRVFWKGAFYAFGLMAVVAVHLAAFRGTPVALKATVFCGTLLLIFLAILLLKDKGKLDDRWIGALLLAAVFLELFSYIHRERPRRFDSFPRVPYIEFLKSSPQRVRSYGNFWAFYPNTATGFQVDDLGFFFGLAPKRFVTFVNHLLVRNIFQKDLRPPALRSIPIQGRDRILDMLNVKYIITPATDRFANIFRHFEKIGGKFKKAYDGEVRIFERPGTFPRVYVVHRAVFEQDPAASLQTIHQLEGRLREVAVIHAPIIPKLLELMKDTPPADRSSARIVSYRPNEVVVHAAMEHPGFLVFSDAFHPGWKVFVNKKPWKLFRANFLIRAVFLPRGLYVVRFIFSPWTFRLGCWVSLIAVALLIGVPVREIRRRHKIKE